VHDSVGFLWLRGGFSENLGKGFLPELPQHLRLLLLVASFIDISVLSLCLTLVTDGRYVVDQHVRHNICELTPCLPYAFSLFRAQNSYRLLPLFSVKKLGIGTCKTSIPVKLVKYLDNNCNRK